MDIIESSINVHTNRTMPDPVTEPAPPRSAVEWVRENAEEVASFIEEAHLYLERCVVEGREEFAQDAYALIDGLRGMMYYLPGYHNREED